MIESVVNTAKTEVGAGQTHIQTTKTVVINDNLPRFLGTADTVEIAPVIFNKTEKDGIFDISIEADHVTLEKSKQSVDIKAGDQALVPFRMVVDGIEKLRTVSPRASKIIIRAVARSSGEMDLMEVTLPIIETTTTEQVATSGRADPTSDEEIALQSDIRANGGSLVVNYAATLLPGLLSGINFLAAYPYGCIEQKLAAIMPQVYMKRLYESLGKPYDLGTIFVKKYIGRGDGYILVSMKDAIGEVMTGLKNYQHPDGGFGYWTALESDWTQWEQSNIFLTLEVVDRLQDLAKVGFSTPPEILSEASKYIKKIFYTNHRNYCSDNCGYGLTDRLHMIA